MNPDLKVSLEIAIKVTQLILEDTNEDETRRRAKIILLNLQRSLQQPEIKESE